jgi:trk system potassium uptake protein TrkH
MRKEARGYRLIFGYLGIFLMFEGLATAFPLLILAFYPSESVCWMDFAIPAVAAVLLGALLFFSLIAGRPKAHFAKHEDSFLLVLLWLCAIVVGAFPFFLTRYPALNGGLSGYTINLFADSSGNVKDGAISFGESFFESASGYCAVGLTVMPSQLFLDSTAGYLCSHVFLFHRAFMQFLGGIGLVLIVAGAISNRYNLKLYFAEGHNDKLMPSLGKSAKLIFGIYSGFIVFGALALWLAGMEPFDAVCHSISALATGGFSTKASGFLFYQAADAAGTTLPNTLWPCNSLAIEIIAMALMIIGGVNFVLHTFFLTFKWNRFFKDIEIRLAIWILVFFTFATTLSSMYMYTDPTTGAYTSLSFAQSLRYNVFNVVTSLTTTGYTNFPKLMSLGEVAVFSGILLQVIGGGVGSTAGGIKQYRIAVLLKDFSYSIKHRFSSTRQVEPNPVYRLGELKEEDASTSDEAHNFALLYIVFFLLGAMALMFIPGITLEEGAYEFNSALSGTGIDIIDGSIAAYRTTKAAAGASDASYLALLWILDVAMFFGRLEILPAYYALKRIFSRPFAHLARKNAPAAQEE